MIKLIMSSIIGGAAGLFIYYCVMEIIECNRQIKMLKEFNDKVSNDMVMVDEVLNNRITD